MIAEMRVCSRIHFEKLNRGNFNRCSLDHFRRHQKVQECWRKVAGKWELQPISFTEEWDLERCREIAADLEQHMEKDQTAFGVFDSEDLIGFITISHNFFGDMAKYAELVCFQISEPYRNMGLGRSLFYMACEEARELGAEKLYISAHSSRETQEAYRAFGCVPAKEINLQLAEEEPYDVPLEYSL